MDTFCSVSCLNEDAEFTDEEIEYLIQQANHEVPSDYHNEWFGIVEPEVTDIESFSRP